MRIFCNSKTFNFEYRFQNQKKLSEMLSYRRKNKRPNIFRSKKKIPNITTVAKSNSQNGPSKPRVIKKNSLNFKWFFFFGIFILCIFFSSLLDCRCLIRILYEQFNSLHFIFCWSQTTLDWTVEWFLYYCISVFISFVRNVYIFSLLLEQAVYNQIQLNKIKFGSI